MAGKHRRPEGNPWTLVKRPAPGLVVGAHVARNALVSPASWSTWRTLRAVVPQQRTGEKR